jgi:hypothetical protein
LIEGAGLEFDPRVVSAFLSLNSIPELESYARKEEPREETWETDAMIRELVDELDARS